MKDLTNGIYTHREICDALHGKTGVRQIKYRYDLIRDGVTIGQLPVSAASVRYRKEDSIRRTARFTLAADDRINWLTDRIKPYMLLRLPDLPLEDGDAVRTWGDLSEYTWGEAMRFTWGSFLDGTAREGGQEERWAQFPLGVFIPSTPTRRYEVTAQYEVEAYDLTVILKEDCVTNRSYFPAGTRYLDAVQSLLVSAGIVEVLVTNSAAVLGTDHEWEVGTTKLEIVNQLLDEINYNPVSFNADGVAVLSPYVEPTPEGVTLEYVDDQLSVIRPEAETELDLYSVPNVFVAVVSNPDRTQTNAEFQFWRKEYVNDNPVSPLSTVKRGRRIVKMLKPNDIASEGELAKYVSRQAFLSSQVYERVEFSTAAMPIHGDNEVLRIRHPDLSGVYEEVAWEIELTAGSPMTHEARRLMLF